ncbi:patatin-like phospholipase domain-containing protein 2 isoform X2 [Esox lucius]|uniref:patatin-like phospholipase domain-containing protein 2 isoform X2 n=1 Tax=Esox lucius TaxID=8010 RepID=UPI000576B4EB|nr:patatin-like phospholipase domain-containing protein 2 isoform X2 [Esox lucius]
MSPARSLGIPLSGDAPLSISFSGSGFLATYQLGVAQCLLNQAPWLLQTAPNIMGASAGSLVAAAVVCGSDLDMVRLEIVKFARQLSDHILGPLHPEGNVGGWIERLLRGFLPADAHIQANGRLLVGMTRIPDGQNILVSEFRSREDLVQVLLCGCFLPGYCGIEPPCYKGVHYLDGGFSCIQPTQASAPGHTLTVSPFAGEADICPPDPSSMFDIVVSGTTMQFSAVNGSRMLDALYPSQWKVLNKAFYNGYRDGLHFLQTSAPPPSPPPEEWSDQETKREEEEEEEVEQESINELTKNRDSQENLSLEAGNLPWNLATLEHSMYQALPTWIRSALLCNLLGLMWTHPLLHVMSYMLLPLTLPLNLLFENTHRLYGLAFWTFQDLRQVALYVINILVSSLHRNLQKRVLPHLQGLLLTKVQAEYEALGDPSQRQRCSTLSLHFSSPSSSTSNTPTPSSPDYEQYTVLLRLDLERGNVERQEKEEIEGNIGREMEGEMEGEMEEWKRFPSYLSVMG